MPGAVLKNGDANSSKRVRRRSERSDESKNSATGTKPKFVNFNEDVRVLSSSYDSGLDRSAAAATSAMLDYHEPLHQSQVVAEPPRVRRNLVRSIVAQFNEDAKRREQLRRKREEEAMLQNGGLAFYRYNDGSPFSYTRNKSFSEMDLKSTPDDDNEVIYAQVVVNGLNNQKSTIHTKINPSSMNRNQSVSMTNLPNRTRIHYNNNNDETTMTMKSNSNKSSHHKSSHKSRNSPEIGLTNGDAIKPKSKSGGAKKTKHVSSKTTTAAATKSSKGNSEIKMAAREPSPDYGGKVSSKARRNIMTKSGMDSGRPLEPMPDYGDADGGLSAGSTRLESTREVIGSSGLSGRLSTVKNGSGGLSKEIILENSKSRKHRNLENGGYLETERNSQSTRMHTTGGNSNNNNPTGSTVIQYQNGDNGITRVVANEYHREENITRTRRHKSNRSPSPEPEVSDRKSTLNKKSSSKSSSSKTKKSATLQNNGYQSPEVSTGSSENNRKFYYFGQNGEVVDRSHQRRSASLDRGPRLSTPLSTPLSSESLTSTKLVKEANAKVNNGQHDSGYSSRGVTPSVATSTPLGERIINVEYEGHYNGHSTGHSAGHYGGHSMDMDEQMETSESDDIQMTSPNLTSSNLTSSNLTSSNHLHRRQWSSSIDEDDVDDVVTSHVNTPGSLVREMGKREISYENSQMASSSSSAHKSWFKNSNIDSSDDVDYRRSNFSPSPKPLKTTIGETGVVNANQVNNNNSWNSLSRIESRNNRTNNDFTTMTTKSSTIDRRQTGSRSNNKNQTGNGDIRIQLNGHDVTDNPNNHGNHPSEDESIPSRKSNGSTSKRVNFKSSTKSNGHHHQSNMAANLSPVHREVLLRSSSPNRPPSRSESVGNSSVDSDNSSTNRSTVILHAMAVADIPPSRAYRNRIHRDSSLDRSNNSRTASPNGVPIGANSSGGSTRTVTRSFSLLSPWKPKKYKHKYEGQHEHNGKQHHSSHMSLNGDHKMNNTSSMKRSKSKSRERMDTISPLASENHVRVEKPRDRVSRHNSMPKDSRFGGFFKKKPRDV